MPLASVGVAIPANIEPRTKKIKDIGSASVFNNSTLSIVNYTKSLGVPVICFPRGISDYKKFCQIVKPSMINIDYDTNPKTLIGKIEVPIQGGLDPKVLLTDNENLKNEVRKAD